MTTSQQQSLYCFIIWSDLTCFHQIKRLCWDSLSSNTGCVALCRALKSPHPQSNWNGSQPEQTNLMNSDAGWRKPSRISNDETFWSVTLVPQNLQASRPYLAYNFSSLDPSVPTSCLLTASLTFLLFSNMPTPGSPQGLGIGYCLCLEGPSPDIPMA